MDRPDPSDEELAARAGRGDRAASGELVGRYAGRVVRFVVRSCGIPEAAAEDLCQEVWLKVWRHLPGKKPGHFRGWLFTIARNAAGDWRKKHARGRAGPLDAVDPATGDSGVGRAAEVREEVGRLRACLDRLTAEFRDVFEGFVGGKTYEALGSESGVPVNTIKSRLNRARAALRKCMGVEDR